MHRWLGVCTVCYFIVAFSSEADAETIYLNSGEKIRGKVVAQSTNAIMIQSQDGTYRSYLPEEIKEIKKDNKTEEEEAENTEKAEK
jgi:hypothetical protein